MIRTICLTLGDNYTGNHSVGPPVPRMSRAMRHFAERGVDAQFFHGMNAAQLGIATTLPYEIDAPGSGEKIGPKPTGCWLSHRAVWSACLLLPDELFLIVEDDVLFPPDWSARAEAAIRNAGDFDLLFVGSCCTADKPKERIAGDVYDVRWPMCLHGYVVRRSALETLIATQDEARLYAPIDVSLLLHTFDRLRVRTVLPRILDQFDTPLHA